MKTFRFQLPFDRGLLIPALFLFVLSTGIISCEKDNNNAVPSETPPDEITFTPANIERGQVLTVSGRDFDSNTKVLFNNKELAVSNLTSTKLEVTIPNDAVDGKVVVKKASGEKQSATALHIYNYWVTYDEQAAPFRQVSNVISFTYNDKIHIAFGGVVRNTDWEDNESVYSYDPIEKKWTVAFTIPKNKVPLRLMPFSAIISNKWYVGGGVTRKDCWEVDLTKSGEDAWTSLSSLANESANESTFILNGKIYLAAATYEKKLLEFEFPANSNDGKGMWISRGDIALGGFNFGNFVAGDKAYMLGWSKMARFDPAQAATGIVDITPADDGNQHYKPVFSYDDKGYCLGNTADNKQHIFVYDSASNRWIKRASTPAFESGVLAEVIKNRIFMIDFTGKVFEYIAK